MNLRKNIITALLIAIGFILRNIVPGVIGGMKFDLMLAVIFVCILINKDFKSAMVTAFLGGVICAMTTTFPGGQLPNIIDKFITCTLVFLMVKFAGKYNRHPLSIGAIAFLGTLISGSIFLISALFIAGLPAPFEILFMGIVLPTAVTNIFVTLIIYKAVNMAIKVTGVKFIQENNI